jgi:hypothetical protein
MLGAYGHEQHGQKELSEKVQNRDRLYDNNNNNNNNNNNSNSSSSSSSSGSSNNNNITNNNDNNNNNNNNYNNDQKELSEKLLIKAQVAEMLIKAKIARRKRLEGLDRCDAIIEKQHLRYFAEMYEHEQQQQEELSEKVQIEAQLAASESAKLLEKSAKHARFAEKVRLLEKVQDPEGSLNTDPDDAKATTGTAPTECGAEVTPRSNMKLVNALFRVYGPEDLPKNGLTTDKLENDAFFG